MCSAADLEALKRRAGGEGQSKEAPPRAADDSKLFLIVTRVVEGRKVHYPLVLTQKTATVAAAAAAASSVAAGTPNSCSRDAAAVEQHQQQQTPRSRVSLGSPQQTHQSLVLQEEPRQQLRYEQKGLGAACAAASDGLLNAGGLFRQVQQPWGPEKGSPHPRWGAPPALQQQASYEAPGGPLNPEATLGPHMKDDRIVSTARAPPKAAGGASHHGNEAAAELLRLRTLVAEQQAALAEARRQNVSREMLGFSPLGGPHALPYFACFYLM